MSPLSNLALSDRIDTAWPSPLPTAENSSSLDALAVARLHKPQRHRLLHGFPLAASMPLLTNQQRASAEAGQLKFQHAYLPQRSLLVGVLPHAFCNPQISGCGFCTFPHEDFSARKATAVVECVQQEITSRLSQSSELSGRPVQALYFGGATANLTPADAFRKLCRQLNNALDLRQAEVTLEGVPAFFIKRRPLLLDILQVVKVSGVNCRACGKGVRSQLPERPCGCFAQLTPDTFTTTLLPLPQFLEWTKP